MLNHITKTGFIFVILFGVLCAPLLGQKTKVSGRVTDAETGEGMPYVTVIFQDSKIGTSSNLDGYYSIETYYATDSLKASFIGYQTQSKKIKKDREQVVNFELSTSSVQLGEAEIVAKDEENPAHAIVRNVIANRKINNREKLDAYEYELYNKVEFDLNNITDEFQDRKIFKPFEFIFDNIDSTEEKVYLPIFMTESISNFYYRRSPKTEKEIIHATKVSGIDNNSVSQFLGDMYQSVNIYDNNVIVFGKSFVSPISSSGFLFYKYFLEDSAYIEDKWCYKITFLPKRKQELTFTGDIWVNDTTYAIKTVEASIADDANINFIQALKVRQEFNQVEHEVWMMTKDQLVVDFNLGERQMGFYGRKTTSYKDFVINKPRQDEFYLGITDVVVDEDANDKAEEFWNESRHLELTENEVAVYNMVDSIQNVPQFRTIIDIVTLFVSGYKKVGNVEIGPYFTMYSFNPIEGHRFRFGGRTSNKFSTRLELNGYLAYGTNDQRFKYGGGFRYMINKNPRMVVGVSGKRDIEQLGKADGAFREDNILSSFFRRNPATKLTDVTETKTYLEREWFYGLSNQVIFSHRILRPLGTLEYTRMTDEFVDEDVHRIATSEVALYTRFAYKEKFVAGEFDRISLGTKFPTFEALMSFGIPGVWGSEYEYQKLVLRLSDKIRLGPLGFVKMRLETGKIWGTLPYPLLQIHQGNETFFYDETAFNLMNFFEFVSDEWASASATYHLDGLFLNKIPLFRKLKWREVVSAKALVGGFDKKHLNEMILPDETYVLSKPYFEAAVGVENIFKILRIDLLTRLSYLDHENIQKWGIRAKLQIDF